LTGVHGVVVVLPAGASVIWEWKSVASLGRPVVVVLVLPFPFGPTTQVRDRGAVGGRCRPKVQYQLTVAVDPGFPWQSNFANGSEDMA